MAVATVSERTGTDLIGATAGIVWHYLAESNPVTLHKLARDLDPPRDLLLQAIGWLAREDKIVIEQNGRSRRIRLR